MNFTDTHTHLYVDTFKEDIDEVMKRANDENINRFFIPAIDSATTEAMYQLEKDFPEQVFLMMGLHPTSVKENYKDELKHIEEQLEKRQFYAIGEIGIDLYWDQTHLREQQDAFRHQIKLAKKYKLPIVIHCRNAFDEVFEILEEEKSEDL
ncbi:MAG: TatD family hydrolase, partial [Psychroflexus halocasei]